MRGEKELLVDALGRLNASGLGYMLTGSMASNYWGIPRTTHDLDFVLLLEARDVPRILTAFGTGFLVQPEAVRRALKPPHQFNVIDDQSALKIDFWVLKDDEFERCAFGRRTRLTLFGVPAWVATAEDMILHKLRWHRITPSERQLGDAAGVYQVQAGRLDLDYLRTWAVRLGVEGEWNDLTSGKIRPKTT